MKKTRTAAKAAEKRSTKKPAPVKKSRATVTPILRVTGIGGFFFKSEAPKDLMSWYQKHLGLEVDEWGGCAFQWREKRRPQRIGATVFNPFAKDTKYFDPSESSYMFNFRVADLHALLTQLRREGVHVIDDVQEFPYGKFGWIIDPEGRKVELWEPPDQDDPFAPPKEKKKS